MARQFDPGDHVGATCHVCDVRVEVPLEGAYSDEAYQAAVDHCTNWMCAHMEAFHSDLMPTGTGSPEGLHKPDRGGGPS